MDMDNEIFPKLELPYLKDSRVVWDYVISQIIKIKKVLKSQDLLACVICQTVYSNQVTNQHRVDKIMKTIYDSF